MFLDKLSKFQLNNFCYFLQLQPYSQNERRLTYSYFRPEVKKLIRRNKGVRFDAGCDPRMAPSFSGHHLRRATVANPDGSSCQYGYFADQSSDPRIGHGRSTDGSLRVIGYDFDRPGPSSGSFGGSGYRS
jgi:hypothetical protein